MHENKGLQYSKDGQDTDSHEVDDVLLDQIFFTVNAETFETLQSLADKPLPITDKLRRLLKTKGVWEK